MAKKGAKKQAVGWTASALMEADLKKVKKEGFLAESAEIIFLTTEVIPTAAGIPGDVSIFPPSQFLSSCPRISSWASFCVQRAAASAHAKFPFACCLLHHFM
jgi:hypothetical protein